ncbi:MAG: ATP-binding protein [Eubacteriaceae bacterium]|jgi:two-component system sensor histidine kinase VicK
MIHLDYRSRMVLFNLILYTVTFLLVTFLAVQGIWYISVNKTQTLINETAQNTELLIEQQTSGLATVQDKTDWYQSKASMLSQVISGYTDGKIYLYSSDGSLLSEMQPDQALYFMQEEYQKCSAGSSSVMSVRSINGQDQIWYMAPVDIDGVRVGYFADVYPLTAVSTITSYVVIVMLIAGLIGLIILTFLIIRFANQFTQPIKDLTRISREIDNGNYNVVIQYKWDDEIGDLTAVYNQMTQNINNSIKQLEGERERLGSVLASLDDGLLALDQQGNIIASNSYLKTYFGVSNPKTIYDFTYQSFLRDIFDSLRLHQNYISEEVECNDRILLLTGSPIHQPGLEENYMIIIRNITATRQLEREQQKFISSVSHELRTPLTTIIGYTDMLKRRNVQDPKLLESSLTTINREGHRLVRLVDDLLSASSLDTLEFTVRRTTISLDSLLRDVVDQMRIKGWQKEVEITYKSESDLPPVLGDYDRLSQMFINILHNALKYSNTGGIVDVILTEEDGFLAASIRDYGTGIDPAQQKLIFSAFYRVEEDRARNKGEGGAGLGLYLVKQIAEKHNGRIQIDSEVGEGTNVTIYLPVLETEINTEEQHDE